jgi:cysteine desulfuration protein SufE
VFVAAEVQGGVVRVYAQAPKEAPTTRGFASVLVHGLDGLPVADALAVPDDYPQTLGLAEAVSPLRLRGMSGLLGRIKRQLRAGGTSGDETDA